MNPSPISNLSPSLSPLGDISDIQVIDQGQTCRFCGAPAKTWVSAHSTCNPICQHCGRRDTDLVTWYFVDHRDKLNPRMASPEFSSFEQAQQFAELFGLHPEEDYGIHEAIHLFNAAEHQQARAEYVEDLEWNARVLDWLLAARATHWGDEGLRQLAVKAQLTGYALPQFRGAAAKGA
jgi:hypothetical protein